MTALATLRAAMVATLSDAGIRATDDPRNVNPPCVLIGLAEGARITACAYTGTIPVTVVAPGAGNADAAGWLDETATTVAGLLGAVTWSADLYAIASVPGGLLSYVLSVPAAWEVPAP